jgi:hypothetical protein
MTGVSAGLSTTVPAFAGATTFSDDDGVAVDDTGVRRGVGKITGVTATTTAVRRSAIRSLLSIYGTGS